jgi:CubicO group peptidase (beta-lactamase class C family)
MMAKKRISIWLILIVLFPGVILAFVVGLWAWASATAPVFHPNPQEVRSETDSEPSRQWADAVARARQLVRTGIADQNLPGISVAVGAGGEIVWAEGFGWADVEKRVPVEPDTRFRIGTASKMLTSAAVGLLMEQGRLKLDDEIQTYVPEFPTKKWPVTLRQLMGHTAGVRRDEGDEEDLRTHCERTTDGVKRFSSSDLLFEPGTRYRYSNYGWFLVSAAVEAAAGDQFFDFMRRQIFQPLGLKDTTADDEPEPKRAVDYFPRFAADPRYGHQGPEQFDYSCFTGSSAFFSTPSDMVRFILAVNAGTLLQPATVQLLQTSQRLRSGEETGYGLGWDLETVELAGAQTRVIGYDGDLRDGIVSSFMIVPRHGLVVAVTSNIAFADTVSLALSIARAFVEPR